MGASNGPQSCALRSCLGINFPKNMVLTPAYAETPNAANICVQFSFSKNWPWNERELRNSEEINMVQWTTACNILIRRKFSGVTTAPPCLLSTRKKYIQRAYAPLNSRWKKSCKRGKKPHQLSFWIFLHQIFPRCLCAPLDGPARSNKIGVDFHCTFYGYTKCTFIYVTWRVSVIPRLQSGRINSSGIQY